MAGPGDWLRRLGLGRRGGRVARLSRAAVDGAANRERAIAYGVYDFLASTDYRELTRRQRVAQLCLFYSNEVDNGGHLQYFHNVGMRRGFALMRALRKIGAEEQRAIFVRAYSYAIRHPVERAESLEDYSERAYEQEFRAEDDEFYACRPDIGGELLPAYVLANLGEFAESE